MFFQCDGVEVVIVRKRAPSEEIDGSDEACNKPVIRILVEISGWPDLNKAAFIHYSNSRSKSHCFFLVMGNDDKGHSELLLNAHQFELSLFA